MSKRLSAWELGDALHGKKASKFQEVVSHAVGYATYPLYRGLDQLFQGAGPRSDKYGVTETARPIKTGDQAEMPGRGRGKRQFQSRGNNRGRRMVRNVVVATKAKTRKIKTAPRPKGGVARKAKFVASGQRKLVTSTKPMPATQMSDINSGTRHYFGAGQKKGCMLMGGRQFAGWLGSDPGASFEIRLPNFQASRGQYYPMAQSNFYMSDPLVRMVQMFNKYRWLRYRFHYCTQSGTQTQLTVKYAYAPDCQYMERAGMADSVDYPSAASMFQLSTMREFPVYSNHVTPWITPQNMYGDPYVYVAGSYNDDFVIQIPFNFGEDPADNRQQCQGVLMWSVEGTQVANQVYGELFIEYEIELCELGFVGVSISVLATRFIKEKKMMDDFMKFYQSKKPQQKTLKLEKVLARLQALELEISETKDDAKSTIEEYVAPKSGASSRSSTRK